MVPMTSQTPIAVALGAILTPVEEGGEPRLYRVEVRVGILDWAPVAHLPVYTDRETAEAAQQGETRRCWAVREALRDDTTEVHYRVTSTPYAWGESDVEGPVTDFERMWRSTLTEIEQIVLNECALPIRNIAVGTQDGLPLLRVSFDAADAGDRDTATAAALALKAHDYLPRVVKIGHPAGDTYEVYIDGPYRLIPNS